MASLPSCNISFPDYLSPLCDCKFFKIVFNRCQETSYVLEPFNELLFSHRTVYSCLLSGLTIISWLNNKVIIIHYYVFTFPSIPTVKLSELPKVQDSIDVWNHFFHFHFEASLLSFPCQVVSLSFRLSILRTSICTQ
uniref:Putative ovule protein n=1 Tax=Solanum chacoense TaxID=4108 RepID=A0A0V0H337_SOLCH